MNFDEPVERRETNCAKWDGAGRYASVTEGDLLPMWIADTDFRAPEGARKALAEMADHGALGYMAGLDDMRASVVWWMQNRHNWTIRPDDILCAGGLGNGIALAIDAMTEPGDEIMIFTPVYHEFRNRIENVGRVAVEVQMHEVEGRMVPNLAAAAEAASDRTKMLIFCSPHNPGGQVWTAPELQAVADFCVAQDMLLISDEIHHDLVFPGATFTPMAKMTGIEDRLIVLTAPSKTFNIAGLRLGHIIIPNDALRDRMNATIVAYSVQPNMAGVIACTAVYSPEGAAWADAQNAYLDENRRIFDAGMDAIPGVRSIPLESTFLSWVDFTGTGMDDTELLERLNIRAKVVPQRGAGFGPGGSQHMRFNIGTQRTNIEEAVRRIQAAFSDLQ
ncbi:MAG: putative C-S lyase [Rhodobacteraceae bacterium]|nr:putative C-S lyase [Paracoccaceae bacterium]